MSVKRKALSLVERFDVLERLDKKESQVSVAKHYGVHSSQICRIYQNKDAILKEWQSNSNPNRKRKRAGKASDVERALLRWFSEARSRQLPVSGSLLMDKAAQLAEELGVQHFKVTRGWLERWKCRNGIMLKKSDSDDVGTERWIVEVLPSIIRGYEPCDIFNADETGLYWRAIPNGTSAFKHCEPHSSCKKAKDSLTLLLCCNMDGSEKLEPLVIGKNRNPRCFKNIKRLPVTYESNKDAWITTTLWNDWLKKLDDVMRERGRQILMLCDNCSAHSDAVKLTNIKLVFLPPNTTSLIQPMDQGIIEDFKRHYKLLVLRHLMAVIDADTTSDIRAAELVRKLTVLDSLHMILEAWSRVASSTILGCYRCAKFVHALDEITESSLTSIKRDRIQDIELPDRISLSEFELYLAVDKDLPTSADSSNADICSTIADTSNIQVSDDENLADTESVSFPEALHHLYKLRCYLEMKGCPDYGLFYGLSDQIHRLNRVKKTTTDYFITS